MRKSMEELLNLFKANIQCIWVTTYEESEFIDDLKELISENFTRMKINSWSSMMGLEEIPIDEIEEVNPPDPQYRDPFRVMQKVIELQSNAESRTSSIMLLKDFHIQLEGIPAIKRAIRDAKEQKRFLNYCPIVVLSPVVSIPPELEKLFTVIDYSIPDKEMLMPFVSKTIAGIQAKSTINKEIVAPSQDSVGEITNALLGLTMREVKESIAKCLIEHKTLDANFIAKQKTQIIKKSGVLSFEIPNIDLNDIGGNENFKDWMEEVKLSLTPEAEAFGCKKSKGYLALGVPGCAKTLFAKAIASDLKVPLLKLDMSKVMDKLVGQSEKKIEQAFSVAKACAPCVMLWDEVEKALGGIKSSNSSDSGATARVFASCLNFLQENNDVFVIMTSNDISQLPPEFTRKGRLDEIWYFGLPTQKEREHIFKIHLDKLKKEYDPSIIEEAAKVTENYSGAEIESAVKSSIWKAFKRYRIDGQDCITNKDLLDSIEEIVPMFLSSKEKIVSLEQWAKGRARYASKNEDVEKTKKKAARLFKDIANISIDD